jgi:hypothetical protein
VCIVRVVKGILASQCTGTTGTSARYGALISHKQEIFAVELFMAPWAKGHKSLNFLRGPKATCTTYDWRSFTSHIGIHPIELLPTGRRSPLTRALADESASTCGAGLCLHTLITTKKSPQDLILLCRSLSLGDTRPSVSLLYSFSSLESPPCCPSKALETPALHCSSRRVLHFFDSLGTGRSRVCRCGLLPRPLGSILYVGK